MSIFTKNTNELKIKEVFIKKYGWLEILKQDGNYALIQFPSGEFVHNINGYEARVKINQLTLF